MRYAYCALRATIVAGAQGYRILLSRLREENTK
jgi:hypothetical protein